jgi:ABC-type polysaccharide/polyol phosphate transport system ATPase subunit
MAHIILRDINLKFWIRQVKHITLKEYLVRGMFLRKRENSVIEVHALKDVNLEMQDGDRLGIVGHNGAGKSTLLKLLAGIYPPTSGKREVEGKISSLFDLALGFEMESNGWDNIRYRGYLQGENYRSLEKKVKAIAEFSELGHFLDLPVRYYSAGMIVRLAFSIASTIEPEILLIDEVLAAGDMAFQNKAKQRMSDLMKHARLMVLISHDMKSIVELCNRAVWMDHGRVMAIGSPQEIVDQYQASVPNAVPVAA